MPKQGAAEGTPVYAAVEVGGGSPTEGAGMFAVSPTFLFLVLDDVLPFLLLFLATGTFMMTSSQSPPLEE